MSARRLLVYRVEEGLVGHNQHVEARGALFMDYAVDHRMSVCADIWQHRCDLVKKHA